MAKFTTDGGINPGRTSRAALTGAKASGNVILAPSVVVDVEELGPNGAGINTSLIVPPGQVGTYKEEIIKLNPLVYYRLDEISGTVAIDSSGNGNNGTYVVAPGVGDAINLDQPPLIQNNEGGRAVDFVSSVVNDPQSLEGGILGPSLGSLNYPITLSIWCKLRFDASRGQQPLKTHAPLTQRSGFGISVGPTGAIAGAVGNGDFSDPADFRFGIGSISMSDDTLHNLVIRFTSFSLIDIFLDGVKDSGVTYSGTNTGVASVGQCSVGIGQTGVLGGTSADGVIDDCAIFTTALADEDIIKLYQIGAGLL